MNAWLGDALLASTLLVVAVILVRPIVRRLFGPRIVYLLWALPALRLLLPPLPDRWTSAYANVGEPASVVLDVPLAAVAAAPETFSVSWAGPLWLAGAGAFLLWHLFAYRRLRGRLLSPSKIVGERGGIRIIESAAAQGAVAFGIFRRYVALPRGFDQRFDAAERSLALAHECGHHARGDLLANWAALGFLAAHWWNPAVWYAFRVYRTDQEAANDAGVLAGRSAADRHAYARAIAKSAGWRGALTACHLHSVADLKGRLRMLSTRRRSGMNRAGGAAMVAALTLGGLVLTASGSGAAHGVPDPALAPSPSADPIGCTESKSFVVPRADGSRREMILCGDDASVTPDRARALAAGMDEAPDAPRLVSDSRTPELLSLRLRRARTEVDPSLAAGPRAEKVTALDQAIARVEEDMAKARRD
jgi:bla regulator protein BlaR1